MQIAKELSELSTCKRKAVGSIIVPTDFSQIYSIGYNGPVRNLSNEACENLQGQCGCVHAEANAVAKFNPLTNKACVLISTTCPCRKCAELIINCGAINFVVYDEPYRNDDGLNLLKDGSIDMHIVRMSAITEDFQQVVRIMKHTTLKIQ